MLMTKYVLPLLWLLPLTSCGSLETNKPNCVTKCGLALYADGANCEDFQLAEDRALKEYAFAVQDWDYAYVCRHVRGFRTYLQKTDETHSWNNPLHGQIQGITYCEFGSLKVAADLPWNQTALCHELGHVIEFCQDFNHIHWADRGMFEACDKANDPNWKSPPDWTLQ